VYVTAAAAAAAASVSVSDEYNIYDVEDNNKSITPHNIIIRTKAVASKS
jgi:hypothetical protein